MDLVDEESAEIEHRASKSSLVIDGHIKEAARDAACLDGVQYLGYIAKTISQEGAAWAAYEYLQANSAGMPMLPLVDGAAREDSRFWSETASPAELECYALAAMDRLRGGPFATRHIKRLVAALYGRMSPDEQKAFKEWVNK